MAAYGVGGYPRTPCRRSRRTARRSSTDKRCRGRWKINIALPSINHNRWPRQGATGAHHPPTSGPGSAAGPGTSGAGWIMEPARRLRAGRAARRRRSRPGPPPGRRPTPRRDPAPRPGRARTPASTSPRAARPNPSGESGSAVSSARTRVVRGLADRARGGAGLGSRCAGIFTDATQRHGKRLDWLRQAR
jgi:hypothetical protein